MKILFYSTKDFERPYLEDAFQTEMLITFIPDALSVKTAGMAMGFDVISIFTGDDASSEVLQLLYGTGVKFIATRAAGYDNIDLKKANELSIAVTNVPEYSSYAIAEHAAALILALNRKIITANRQVHDQDFTTGNLIGFDLHGKTVGIIGVGRIGAVFAKIMHGFGCRLLGYDITENKNLAEEYQLEYVDLPTLCRESNIISIHTSLDGASKYMIDKKMIGLMQPGTMLINTSRGACVQTREVVEALENGSLGYYGADVYEYERGLFFYDHRAEELKDALLKRLMTMTNVLITPHQGFATREALANIAETTFVNIDSWVNGRRSGNELSL